MTTAKQLQGCRQSINTGISALKLDSALTNQHEDFHAGT